MRRRLFPSLLKRVCAMKISGVEIRPGNIIEYEGGIWKVTKIQHTQPGKGGAYMQVEAKNLIDGRKLNNRFRSADTVEKVRIDTKDFQFIYAEGRSEEHTSELQSLMRRPYAIFYLKKKKKHKTTPHHH